MGPRTEQGLYDAFAAISDDAALTIEPGYVETRHGSAAGVRLLVDDRLLATLSRRRFLRALQIELARDFHAGEELVLEPDEEPTP